MESGFFFILNDDLVKTKQSFQDGVNSLYNKLVSLGFTPANKDLNSILSAIDKLYNDRYNSGYATGYNDGRIQGRNDVISNPGDYGITIGISTIRLKIGYPRNSQNAYVNLSINKDSNGNVSSIIPSPSSLYFGNDNEIRFTTDSFS